MRGCPICEAFGEQYCRKHGSDDLEATIARLTAERDAALAVAREYVPRCRDCGAAAVGEASCFNIEADGSEEIEAYCEDHAGDCDVRFNVAPAIRLLGPLLERVK